MNDTCETCKTLGSHCNGTGIYELFDQDGINRYMCQCHCGYSRRQNESASYALAPLIRQYGKDTLLKILGEM